MPFEIDEAMTFLGGDGAAAEAPGVTEAPDAPAEEQVEAQPAETPAPVPEVEPAAEETEEPADEAAPKEDAEAEVEAEEDEAPAEPDKPTRRPSGHQRQRAKIARLEEDVGRGTAEVQRLGQREAEWATLVHQEQQDRARLTAENEELRAAMTKAGVQAPAVNASHGATQRELADLKFQQQLHAQQAQAQQSAQLDHAAAELLGEARAHAELHSVDVSDILHFAQTPSMQGKTIADIAKAVARFHGAPAAKALSPAAAQLKKNQAAPKTLKRGGSTPPPKQNHDNSVDGMEAFLASRADGVVP